MTNSTFYLICNGTGVNDIINSFNKFAPDELRKMKKTNEKKSWFSGGNTMKIEKEPYNRLDKIGLKELSLCKKNKMNKEIFEKIETVYTSADFKSIESAIYLFNNKKEITPIPYISNKDEITTKTFLEIKKKFGVVNGNNNFSNTKIKSDYWTNKKINSNIKTLGEDVKASINWTEIKDNLKNMKYNWTKFEKLLKNKKMDNVAIVTNGEFIKDVYAKIYSKSWFNSANLEHKTPSIIENGSVWEIHYENNIFISMTQVFPQENRYDPLKSVGLNRNKKTVYKYSFENYNYILFNSLKPIPFEYIKNMNFDFLYDKTTIQELIRSISKNKKVNNNNSIKNLSNLS